jgi:regulator of replication initiation timing
LEEQNIELNKQLSHMMSEMEEFKDSVDIVAKQNTILKNENITLTEQNTALKNIEIEKNKIKKEMLEYKDKFVEQVQKYNKFKKQHQPNHDNEISMDF